MCVFVSFLYHRYLLIFLRHIDGGVGREAANKKKVCCIPSFKLNHGWFWCGCKVDAIAVRKAGCGHTRKRAYARAANPGAAMARRTLSPLILYPNSCPFTSVSFFPTHLVQQYLGLTTTLCDSTFEHVIALPKAQR